MARFLKKKNSKNSIEKRKIKTIQVVFHKFDENWHLYILKVEFKKYLNNNLSNNHSFWKNGSIFILLNIKKLYLKLKKKNYRKSLLSKITMKIGFFVALHI